MNQLQLTCYCFNYIQQTRSAKADPLHITIPLPLFITKYQLIAILFYLTWNIRYLVTRLYEIVSLSVGKLVHYFSQTPKGPVKLVLLVFH